MKGIAKITDKVALQKMQQLQMVIGKGLPIDYQERDDATWCNAVLLFEGDVLKIVDVADANAHVITFAVVPLIW